MQDNMDDWDSLKWDDVLLAEPVRECEIEADIIGF